MNTYEQVLAALRAAVEMMDDAPQSASEIAWLEQAEAAIAIAEKNPPPKPSKADLIAENKKLKNAISVRDLYLSHAFRSEVTFIQKGSMRLGICGETRAHGGIVLHAWRDEGKWNVLTVEHWETFAQLVRVYPYRHDDKEGHDLRDCVEQVAKHVQAKQNAVAVTS